MSLAVDALRARCAGVLPLDGRLEPWQSALCSDPASVRDLVAEHGSPLNLLDPAPMARNAGRLTRAAEAAGVRLRIYLARKANKALAFVDAATRLGLGVDLAGERELAQVLARGLPGDDLVMTAAIKPPALIAECVEAGVLIVLDNLDELRAVDGRARALGIDARVALRLCPDLGAHRTPSRFGFEVADAVALAGGNWPAALRLEAAHFHLDGYAADDRVRAIGQALPLIDAARSAGHPVGVLDMGGGIPMSYLDDPAQWAAFWEGLRLALAGGRPPVTFEGHGLGLTAHRGEVLGSPSVYPYLQAPVGGEWLSRVLATRLPGDGTPVARALTGRGLTLACEPGRALLDGCGMTVARVVHRKRRRDGVWLVALEMNRTQCRSTSDDFLVDPLVLRPGRPADADPATAGPIEGFLVGAYCIERELLTWRRLRFPAGVAVGDLVAWPNTAGYLMHILESASHQIPLARNLVAASGGFVPDPIDAEG